MTHDFGKFASSYREASDKSQFYREKAGEIVRDEGGTDNMTLLRNGLGLMKPADLRSAPRFEWSYNNDQRLLSIVCADFAKSCGSAQPAFDSMLMLERMIRLAPKFDPDDPQNLDITIEQGAITLTQSEKVLIDKKPLIEEVVTTSNVPADTVGTDHSDVATVENAPAALPATVAATAPLPARSATNTPEDHTEADDEAPCGPAEPPPRIGGTERLPREAATERFGKFNRNKIDGTIRREKSRDVQTRLRNLADSLKGIPTKVAKRPGAEGILTSYQKLLAGTAREELIVDFSGADCVTYVETVVAMSLSNSYDEFVTTLRNIRYKNGEVSYAARNHYISADWVRNNGRYVEDLTRDIGGSNVSTVTKTLNLIDRNLDGKMEQENAAITYIPKDRVPKIKEQIQDGDIIVITASRRDLDVQHVGFARWVDGELYLQHAKDGKNVTIDEKPLTSYLTSNRRFSGIQIVRGKETETA